MNGRILKSLSRGDVPNITSLRKAARSLLGRFPPSAYSTSSTSSSRNSSFSAWRQILNSEPPTGFEKFFPKGGGAKKSAAAGEKPAAEKTAEKATSKKSKDFSFSFEIKKGGGGGGGGGAGEGPKFDPLTTIGGE